MRIAYLCTVYCTPFWLKAEVGALSWMSVMSSCGVVCSWPRKFSIREAEDGLSAVDDEASLSEVRLLVSPIGDWIGQGLEAALPSYASKWTHFCLLLLYRGNQPALLVERVDDGVLVRRVPDHVRVSDEVTVPKKLELFSTSKQQFRQVSIKKVASYEVTHERVKSFVTLQRTKSFNGMTKNCKHLCWDFSKEIFRPKMLATQRWLQWIGYTHSEQKTFEAWCKLHEGTYASHP